MEWPLLEHVPAEDVRALTSMARRRTFARGEVVFHRDDPAETFHLIRKGRFAVRIVTPLGGTAILNVLGPGGFFGEIALLSGERRRSATIIALEPAETLSILDRDFAALRARHPQIGDVLVTLLAGQVRRLSEQLIEALYVPAESRVLRRLHELAALYATPDGGAPVVPLTQEELAGLAGTSRATVNRVLREQERAGVVTLRRGTTVVDDREALAALAARPG